MVTISAKIGRGENVVATGSVEYDMPETLAGLVEKFGEGEVFDAVIASFTIAIQNVIRGELSEDSETSQEALDAAVNAWQPGVRRSSGPVDPMTKAKNAFGKMSPEDQAALLKQLQDRLAATA